MKPIFSFPRSRWSRKLISLISYKSLRAFLSCAVVVFVAVNTITVAPALSRWSGDHKEHGGHKEHSGGSHKNDDSFDFYVFPQMWWIEGCYSAENSLENCTFLDKNPFLGNNLRAFGLWPTRIGGDSKEAEHQDDHNGPSVSKMEAFSSSSVGRQPLPADCKKDPLYKKDLSDDLKTRMRNMGMINFMYLNHEWEKHGTCSPFSKEQYFTKFVELDAKFVTPELVHKNMGGKVSYKDLANAYGGEDCVLIRCAKYKGDPGKQYLSGILFALAKEDLKPICKYINTKGDKHQCDQDMPINIRKADLNGIIN